ncbi:MAG: hypothetical protein K0R97_1178 [Oerskovia sp.]|nr:hypothetical protein [Oerskovia sp.]
MAVTVQKLDQNRHKDGETTYENADRIMVTEGVLFVQERGGTGGAKNLAIYQRDFWISADVK